MDSSASYSNSQVTPTKIEFKFSPLTAHSGPAQYSGVLIRCIGPASALIIVIALDVAIIALHSFTDPSNVIPIISSSLVTLASTIIHFLRILTMQHSEAVS